MEQWAMRAEARRRRRGTICSDQRLLVRGREFRSLLRLAISFAHSLPISNKLTKEKREQQ